MLFYSLKNNDEIFVKNPFGFPTGMRIENYINAWNNYNIPSYFLNSMIVAFATVFLTISLSLMFSYATARMKWRFSNVARIYVMAGMFIPVQIILVPLVVLMQKFGLSNSLWSLIPELSISCCLRRTKMPSVLILNLVNSGSKPGREDVIEAFFSKKLTMPTLIDNVPSCLLFIMIAVYD